MQLGYSTYPQVELKKFLEREARAGDVFVFCGTSELLQVEEIRSVGL